MSILLSELQVNRAMRNAAGTGVALVENSGTASVSY